MQPIYVLAETRLGHVTDPTLELLALGRELAGKLGARLEALVLGRDGLAAVSELGAADGAIALDHDALAAVTPGAWVWALEAVMALRKPRLLLIPASNNLLGIGAALAARLGSQLANSCRAIEPRDGDLIATCVLHGGKVEAEVRLPADCAIAVMAPGAAPAEKGRVTRSVVPEPFPLPEFPGARVRFVRTIPPAAGDVDITRTPVLVGVGRGLAQKEELAIAQELAHALGGEVAASRPIVDQGWLPATRQVGRSGMTVKPRLYLALGISGAPEHVEGMKGAGLVVAVNTDPKAPIFDVASYGAAIDAAELMPALLEEIRRSKPKAA